LGVVLSQLRDKPRFATLMGILARPFQELEDVFWDVYEKTQLPNAQGVQLDMIGRLVLEPRDGLNDSDYRSIIRIKLLVLLSHGTGPELVAIMNKFLLTSNFDYDELYPATITITIYDAVSADRLARMKRLLRRAKSGGVRLNVIYAYAAIGTPFSYGGGPYGISPYSAIV